jgi:NADH-quinone oxidoreductase subunit G
VRADALAGGLALDNRQNGVAVTEGAVEPGLWRLGEVPLYGLDALTRRASALQQTAAAPRAWMHGTLMNEMGIGEGETVVLRQGAGEARIEAARDDRLAPGTVRVDSAPGGLLHPIEVEKAR